MEHAPKTWAFAGFSLSIRSPELASGRQASGHFPGKSGIFAQAPLNNKSWQTGKWPFSLGKWHFCTGTFEQQKLDPSWSNLRLLGVPELIFGVGLGFGVHLNLEFGAVLNPPNPFNFSSLLKIILANSRQLRKCPKTLGFCRIFC